MVDKKQLGKRLKRVRELEHLKSARALALRINADPSYYSKAEKGGGLSDEYLEKIVSDLGYNKSWLYLGIGPEKGAIAPNSDSMAYSGMRFSDAMRFDPAHHVIDGRIVMQYQKGNTDVAIKINSLLQPIIDILPDNRMRCRNRVFNDTLKLIQHLCGIDKHLTAHVGRHTLGGFLAEMKVSKEDAQKLLGHKDGRSTSIYFHQKQHTLDASMDRLGELKAQVS